MSAGQLWRVRMAAQKLKRGAVMAYPTEGVWGLGCLPENKEAVARILDLKQRSWTKGLILVAATVDQLLPYIELPSPDDVRELGKTLTSPVTYLVPASPLTPSWITGEHSTVAVRVANHPVIQDICNQLQGPLVSTSANPAGKAPALTRLEVIRYFGDRVDLVFPGALGGSSGPSEIRELGTGKVFRQGGT